jgi:uncharacterized protein
MEWLYEKDPEGITLTGWRKSALQEFINKMQDHNKKFPCIPAIQGFKQNHLRYGFADEPRTASAAEQLAGLLEKFSHTADQNDDYVALVVFLSNRITKPKN